MRRKIYDPRQMVMSFIEFNEIENLQLHMDKLSEWEKRFADDIITQVKLTSKQKAKVNEIYRKVTKENKDDRRI